MNVNTILETLRKGERVTLECKKAQSSVPNSVWESYSAFANTYGGLILLGVFEDMNEKDINKRFTITGVDNAEKIRRDFWNLVNNAEKVNVSLLKDEDVESFKLRIAEWPELIRSIDRIIRRLSKSPEGKNEAFIDSGVFTVSIRREGDKYYARRVQAQHEVRNTLYDFELKEESDGTQRVFDFVPMVQNVKSKDYTYVIDEIDRSLHPTLVRALVNKIVTDKNMKGQLIFTTHDAGLLDGKIFRNDEIWFAEKDRETQSTNLYTLDEFKPRADLDIEKGYLNGRFGAIPFLAKLNELNWEE